MKIVHQLNSFFPLLNDVKEPYVLPKNRRKIKITILLTKKKLR
jgi:hypothetical protein